MQCAVICFCVRAFVCLLVTFDTFPKYCGLGMKVSMQTVLLLMFYMAMHDACTMSVANIAGFHV
jgi:hypothetical protein